MMSAKEQTKTPVIKHVLIGASLAFGLLLLVGFIQFKGSEILSNINSRSNSSISVLNHGWVYEIENSLAQPTSLPNILTLPPSTRKITLRSQLPDSVIHGGGIRFSPIMSAVSIYIDGELVTTYGEITDYNHFIYNSASGIIFVPLKPEQYGTEIMMELTSRYSTELGMLEAPQIGSHQDFILNDLLNNTPNIFLLMILLLFAFILLIFYTIFRTLHNQHLELVAFSVFTFLIILLYNTSNSLVWEIFSYSYTLPALNAWLFFIIDGFIPILGYLILLMVTRKQHSKGTYTFMCLHGALYITGALLQVTWVLSINYLRPLLMLTSFISYSFLFLTLKPWQSKGETKYYQLAVFIMIGAQALDYFKYLLAFLPVSQKTIIWLNLEVPFLFFLPFAAIIYIVMLSYALFFITRSDLGDIKDKAQKDLLTGIYNRSTMEDFISTYIDSCKDLAGFIVIDLNHFKSINDTLGHLYGDQVLIQVARKLEVYFGNTDIVARLGGDEFGIFAHNLSYESEIQEKAALAETVLQEIKINTNLQHLTASVGFSLYPECNTYNQLYEASDLVMYEQKKLSREV